MNNPQDTLNLKEVAELLGVSERTIYNWAQKKFIPAFKLGKLWKFNKAEILNWYNSNRSAETTILAYDTGPTESYLRYNLPRPTTGYSNPYIEKRANEQIQKYNSSKQEENKNLLLKKCPRCNSAVKIVLSQSYRNPDREYYKCLGINNCWIGWVDEFEDYEDNEIKINLFTNHIEIEMTKRPDGILSFEVFKEQYPEDTINEGLKRLNKFGYKLQETQVTKHSFIIRS